MKMAWRKQPVNVGFNWVVMHSDRTYGSVVNDVTLRKNLVSAQSQKAT